jgi:hypothetical protein
MPRIQLQPSLLERLDCFFFSFLLCCLHSLSLTHGLSHLQCPDHITCVITIQISSPKAVVFRIESNWMEHEDYLPTVEKIWIESIFDGDAVQKFKF